VTLKGWLKPIGKAYSHINLLIFSMEAGMLAADSGAVMVSLSLS
jgi:hypothetical protein